MRKVARSAILDYQTYNDARAAFRAGVLEEKAKRRVHVGEHLTFLFETTATVRYQIQEMMRVERLVRERDIQHELDTYNALLGESGELGCTLLIEIEEAVRRDECLRAWLNLPQHLYVTVDGGQRVRPRWDPAQVGEGRLSSVQYLKFPLHDATPAAVGCDHPAINAETLLNPEQRQALLADLRS
jgi:hypothetical protein